MLDHQLLSELPVKTLTSNFEAIENVQFSLDGSLLVCASTKQTVIWKLDKTLNPNSGNESYCMIDGGFVEGVENKGICEWVSVISFTDSWW